MRRAVVIGGGTGAPVSIQALLAMGLETSAVVAMADDGGSSGLLRINPGILPPGDIRKCLVAMASDQGSPWVQAFTQRLEYVDGHPLGNLMLATLSELSGSLPAAIELCGELLGARGRVYPSTLANVQLSGVTLTGERLEGQAILTRSSSALVEVSLMPTRPQAYSAALEAIQAADLIVLGPGSLFTSIIPNLLVPDVLAAIGESRAVTVFLCSLADMQGETSGMDVVGHTEALLRHGLRGRLDWVVAHLPEPLPPQWHSIRRVALGENAAERLAALGPELLVAPLADPLRPTWHDPAALVVVLGEVLGEDPGEAQDEAQDQIPGEVLS
ncbi:MAG: YvcK family protein [Coriobacteriia bacterium]|nr:YvcK family protein [Coriobacteriia bacterium]